MCAKVTNISTIITKTTNTKYEKQKKFRLMLIIFNMTERKISDVFRSCNHVHIRKTKVKRKNKLDTLSHTHTRPQSTCNSVSVNVIRIRMYASE